MVLSADGTVTYTFGALVDFKYEVKGNKITTTLLHSGQTVPGEVSVQEFNIEGDTLIIDPNDPEKKQVMKRVGKQYPTAHPIVGEWTYKHYTGGPAYMRYARSGIVELSVPFQSLLGKYRLNKNIIEFELQGQNPVMNKILYSKSSIVLTDDSGK